MPTREKCVKELDFSKSNFDNDVMIAAILMHIENGRGSVGYEDELERRIERLADSGPNVVVYGLHEARVGITAVALVIHNFALGFHKRSMSHRGPGYNFSYIHEVAFHPDKRGPEDTAALLTHVGQKALEHDDADIAIHLVGGGTLVVDELGLQEQFERVGFRRNDQLDYEIFTVPALELSAAALV